MSNSSISVRNDAVCGHFYGFDDDNKRCLRENTCCACADTRSPEMGFAMEEGVRQTTYYLRWGSYCNRCHDYWTERRLGLTPGWWTDFPHRLIALMNSVPKEPPPSISSSSNYPPLVVAAPDTGRNLPARVAPPLTPRSPDSDIPRTWADLVAVQARRNTPARVAPPPITSSPDSDIPVTIVPSPNTRLWFDLEARARGDRPARVAPPPTISSPASNVRARVAPPPTTSSSDSDIPLTIVPSPNTRPWFDFVEARARANMPARVAPPPTTSSPARNIPVTVEPSRATPTRASLLVGQAAPPPNLSKSARKKAAKRARAAAQEEERQRILASQAIPALLPLPAQDNVPPPGNRAGALPIAPAPAPAPATLYPPPGTVYHPRFTGNAQRQSPLPQNSSNPEEISNDYSYLQLRRLLQPQYTPVHTGTESQGSNPLQTRLRVANNSVAEAEPEISGLGYNASGSTLARERRRQFYDNFSEYLDLRDNGPEPERSYYGRMRPSLVNSGTDSDKNEEEEAYGGDEWETVPADLLRQEPATTILTNATPPVPPPLSEEMRQLAEDTSVILELIGKTDPGGNSGMDSDYKQIIDDAFENIRKIRTQYRVALALKAGSVNLTQDPTPIVEDTLKIDSACIICCDEISNTVLIPCNHLVLCMTCSDKMGIKEKSAPGSRTITCPICRRLVLDRIKIFRG